MRLAPNTGKILRKAWSIRLIVLAGILSALEQVLPALAGSFISPWVNTLIGIATPVVIAGAFVARLVAQKSMEPTQEETEKWGR